MGPKVQLVEPATRAHPDPQAPLATPATEGCQAGLAYRELMDYQDPQGPCSCCRSGLGRVAEIKVPLCPLRKLKPRLSSNRPGWR